MIADDRVPDADQLAELSRAAGVVLDRTWGDARTAGAADAAERLAATWGAGEEAGWFDLGGSLAAAVAVSDVLGRAGCPLPVGDRLTAAALVDPGAARVEVVSGAVPGRAPYLQAAGVATHALVLPAAVGGRALLAPLVPGGVRPGLAAPAWHDAAVALVEALEIDATPAALDEARARLRLSLAARALGAAARAHELAVEHATVRVQFGRVIGTYQAVQHRAVDAAVALTTGRALLADAAGRHDAGDPTWLLAAGLAAAHVARSAPRVQLAAHRTLAAIGYFEEHEAPWLFRRLHADLAIASSHQAGGGAGALLLEGGGSLPPLRLGARADAVRAELRAFLAAHPPSGEPGIEPDPAFVGALAGAGWLARALPPELGGTADPVEDLVVAEELAYARARAAHARAAIRLFGPALAAFATPQQREELVPLLREGRLHFYLGYSEPEVGSDLASLRTRAVRDGDDWIVSGRKMWGTTADVAEWVWLAARTDPDSTGRDGITVFLCPTRVPGWEAQPHRALSGEVSCSTFFDEVRVPDRYRIGPVHGGWAVVLTALAAERSVMAEHVAALHRQLDDLLDLLRGGAAPAPRGSAARATVTELAARLQGARLLLARSVLATATGGGGLLEAPMAKLVAGDLAEDLGEAALALLGPAGALGAGADGALAQGSFEYGLRLAPMYVVGGGTADVQRNLLARAIGLPSSR